MSRVDNDYRLYDGVATTDSTSPSGLPVDNLFDNNPSTEWSAPIEPLIQVTYTFNYRRHEWFNTYSLTSSGSYPERDPTTWRLEGSKDGLTWNRIDYQSNYVFSGRRQTATFMVKSNRVSYNMLRLVIIKVRGATESIAQLSEFAIYASEGELLESGLSYETTEFTYMSAITENFSIKPVSSGYLNFAINPALPAGIMIDADSGEISGSTTETTAALSDYTITATDSVSGTQGTAVIKLWFTNCNDDLHTRIDIVKYNQPGSDRESWRLSCNDMSEFSGQGLDGELMQVNRMCVSRTMCKLTLSDSMGDAWVKGSYVDITLYTKDIAYHLGHAMVTDSDTYEVDINTDFLVSPGSDSIKIYKGSEFRANWVTDTAFQGDANWVVANTAPLIDRRQWYAFTTFMAPTNLTDFDAYEVRFFCRAGVRMYVNGRERYLLNMENETLSATTSITGGSVSPYWHSFTGAIADLLAGSNTIAFDVVNAMGNLTADFDVSVYLTVSSQGISYTEDVTTESSSNSGSYPVDRIADSDWESYTLLPRTSSTDQQWVGIRYRDDSRRLINYYCVTCNPDTSGYDPTEWDFVASNSDVSIANWTVLDTRKNVRFTKRSQRLCFTAETAESYNMYRLVMKANRNIYPTNAFAVSELELYSAALIPKQPFTYQFSTFKGYKDLPFPVLTTLASVGEVTVSPSLPSGLSLDKYTGRISGTPTVATVGATTTYTLTNTVNGQAENFQMNLIMPAGKSQTVFLRDSHIEETVGKLFREFEEPGPRTHCGGDRDHFRVFFREFDHGRAELRGKIGAGGGVFRVSGMRIEAGYAVKFFRRLLGIFAARAFFRDDMHNDRTVEIFDAVECLDQFRQSVPVDGSYVAQSHFLEKNTGHEEAFSRFFKFLDSADDIASAGHALHRHFCKCLEMVVTAPRDDAVEVIRNGADRFRDRHFIVVHNDDQILAAGTDIVQRLKRQPADQGTVADDGDHMFIAAACVACGGESHCGGNRGSGMAAAETVELGLLAQCETGKPVVRTDRMETILSSGQ